jgi:membrane protein implicated in regulation of membrane protease activity
MSFLGFAILLAAVATVYSLVSGISAMAAGRETGERGEEKWMWRRVLFQAVTLALVVVAYLLQQME